MAARRAGDTPRPLPSGWPWRPPGPVALRASAAHKPLGPACWCTAGRSARALRSQSSPTARAFG
eukprot:7941428-Alexandrium_andersonii.AAC.1